MSEAEPDQELIKTAARLLRDGQLVSFPTETVYGLGADARNARAIKRLYEAKGRPSSHPVIVHLHSYEQVSDWAIDLPETFYKLAKAFWPGPMTVILKRAAGVLDDITGAQNTVGLRVPNHPLALALLREFDGGVVAPSANKFGRLSPTSAQDVRDEFGSSLSLVLDGGNCQVGIESTIVDLTGASPRVLRPGMLSQKQIFSVAGFSQPESSGYVPSKGEKIGIDTSDIKTTSYDTAGDVAEVRVPGSLASHYAPSTRVQLIASGSLNQFITSSLAQGISMSVISFQSCAPGFTESSWITMPPDPHDFARLIYGSLRKLDRLNLHLIVVELPTEAQVLSEFDGGHADWDGIIDRLERAAFKG